MTSTDLVRPENLIANYEGWFAQMLPSHVKPEQFTRVAVGALRRDPKLMEAATTNPTSLIDCLSHAARLGLEPGTKEFWLIPRKIKGTNTVTGFPGWEGYVELMYRAGAVTSVKAELVFENDEFDYSPSMPRPVHRVRWFSERGKILGAYAYAEMVGGGVSKVVMVGPDQIARARSASAGAERPDSPWSTDYGAMVLKTALRQLQKWVPTSAEYRREQLRAAVEVSREVPAGPLVATQVPGVAVDADGVMHYDPSDYADADIVEDGAES